MARPLFDFERGLSDCFAQWWGAHHRRGLSPNSITKTASVPNSEVAGCKTWAPLNATAMPYVIHV
jgi:hypothetical protein